MGQTETATDQPAIAEQCLDLIGRRIGRDVEILGMQLEHRVTHAAANEEGLVACLVQSVQNLECALGEFGARDVVLRPRDYSWFSGPVLRVLGQYRSVCRSVMAPYDSSSTGAHAHLFQNAAPAV